MNINVARGKTIRNPFSKKTKNKQKKQPLLLVIFLSLLILLLSSYFFVLLSRAFESESDSNSTIINVNKVANSVVDPNPSIDVNADSKANINADVNTNTDSSSDGKKVIAYAISLTSCSESPSLVDGAAALAHSIHLNSIRNTNTINKTPPSKYDYKLYAFIHTSVIEEGGENNKDVKNNRCASILKTIGYEIMVVDIPVPLNEIENEFLRTKLPSNGCCGEKEFIKLWSYTLTQHPFVVHLDLDTIVMKPMDELFDYGLYGTPLSEMEVGGKNLSEQEEAAKKGIIMWNKEEQKSIEDKNNWSNINAFFTRDYNMRPAGKKPVGVQGGFLIVRPSQTVFSEFQSIIRKGDFQSGKGWGGLGYQFYGAMTFQGIIPYYYDIISPGTSIELNRCMYNVMADNPRDKRTVNNKVSGNCRDGRADCEDCRERVVGDVRTAHFTLCQKPWECLAHTQNVLQHTLCRQLTAEWYKVRADLELSWLGKSLFEEENKNNGASIVVGNGSFDKNHFRGFCNKSGKKGYTAMKLPGLSEVN
jgi:hypothetical protein